MTKDKVIKYNIKGLKLDKKKLEKSTILEYFYSLHFLIIFIQKHSRIFKVPNYLYIQHLKIREMNKLMNKYNQIFFFLKFSFHFPSKIFSLVWKETDSTFPLSCMQNSSSSKKSETLQLWFMFLFMFWIKESNFSRLLRNFQDKICYIPFFTFQLFFFALFLLKFWNTIYFWIW